MSWEAWGSNPIHDVELIECDECNGTGLDVVNGGECKRCDGTGDVVREYYPENDIREL